MTEQELKKLSRMDLVEMLMILSRENGQLRAELDQAREQLEDRTIAVENAGSLAEASLALNGVLEAAQAAANQYLQNIQQREEQQKQVCAQMEQETREKCNRMMMAAKRQADDYLMQVNAKIRKLNESYSRQNDYLKDLRPEGDQDEQ